MIKTLGIVGVLALVVAVIAHNQVETPTTTDAAPARSSLDHAVEPSQGVDAQKSTGSTDPRDAVAIVARARKVAAAMSTRSAGERFERVAVEHIDKLRDFGADLSARTDAAYLAAFRAFARDDDELADLLAALDDFRAARGGDVKELGDRFRRTVREILGDRFEAYRSKLSEELTASVDGFDFELPPLPDDYPGKR